MFMDQTAKKGGDMTGMSLCFYRIKRQKSGSMEEDVDSPAGEYYHSPSSPASSSRNWTDDMEGGNTTK